MFVSAVYQSDSVIHGFFVIFVPIMVYHRILNIVLYAIHLGLIVHAVLYIYTYIYVYIYTSLHLLTPDSHSVPLQYTHPLGSPKSAVSVSLLLFHR